MRWCLLLLLIAAGCGLLKNNTVTTDRSSESGVSKTKLKIIENTDFMKRDESLRIYNSAADHDYTVQLWPKGGFTYSIEKGFAGEADSLVVSGKWRTEAAVADQVNIVEGYKKGVERDFSEDAKHSSKVSTTVKSSSVSWKWVVAGVFVIGAGLWWWRR